MRPHLLLLSLVLAPTLLHAQTAAAPPKPVTLRSILLAQLRSTHNQAEWFVPVNAAVAGLTPEQARWIPPSTGPHNPAPADHSVGMLTYHLLFWNREELSKVRGEKHTPFSGNNTETFNKWDARSWSTTVEQLDHVLTDLEHFVETADDAKLAAFASEIAHIGTHNAYHTGQIIEIRKLQGTWDPEKGVK